MLFKKIVLFPLSITHRVSSSKHGFSLVELIVVVAIIAVMTALSMVSFSSLTGSRLTADARKIVNDLCWTRQLAVSGHQNYVDTGRQNYIVDFDTLNERYTVYWGIVAPNNQVKTQALGTGIDLVSVAPSTLLTFSFPQGTASATTTITLNSQGKTKTVQVFANTGYVKIQ